MTTQKAVNDLITAGVSQGRELEPFRAALEAIAKASGVPHAKRVIEAIAPTPLGATRALQARVDERMKTEPRLGFVTATRAVQAEQPALTALAYSSPPDAAVAALKEGVRERAQVELDAFVAEKMAAGIGYREAMRMASQERRTTFEAVFAPH